MTPRQLHVFDELLAIGIARPFMPAGLVDSLRARLSQQLTPIVHRWSEPSLWLTKSTVMTLSRCEAAFVHSREKAPGPGGVNVTSAAGDVAHRAVQLSYTHPDQSVPTYVDAAVHACQADATFAQWWSQANMATQSQVLLSAASKVTALLDSWPAIVPAWEPRFEENVQSKIAGVTLAARLDLVLGRPRASGQQSMVVVDWKSGSLSEAHRLEAAYHALVCTLSYGVAPFRSFVYSLASAEHTDPDVDPAMLEEAVALVVTTAARYVDLLTGRDQPTLRCEQPWCDGCAPAAHGEARQAA